MDRRSFLRFAAVPLLAALVAGCQTPAAAPGGSGDSGGGGQPAGPKVERLVFLVSPPPQIMFEVRNMAEPWSWPVRPMYDYLFGINNKTSKIEPGLLESWAYEQDGKALRGKLRKGVQFHGDFGELKASDVRFGWERMTKATPESTHGQFAFWRNIEDIQIVNDHEVLFKVTNVDGNLVVGLSEQQGGIEVQSEAHFKKLGAPPTMPTGPLAGSGPYQHLANDDATFLRFKRVAWKHWRATPDFPEFEFRYAAESSTRQAAFLAGEAHITNLPQDLMKAAEAQGAKVIKGVLPGTRVFGALRGGMLKDVNDASQGRLYPDSPLNDVRVRKAMNKAINKDELNKAFFAGKGEPMMVHHMHPSRPGWNPAWEQKYKDAYGYDPAAARALLAEAGYNVQRPLRTSIIIQPLPGIGPGGDLSEALANYMRQVGIQVDLVQVDPATYNTTNRARQYDNHIMASATGSNIWSGWTIWNSSLVAAATSTAVTDNTVDRLLRELRGTVDEKKRDELWRQVGDTGFDAYMNLNLFYLPAEVVVNPKIVGGWVFPGDITGGYTHVWEIKTAK